MTPGNVVLTATLGGHWGARMACKIQGPWLHRRVIAIGSELTVYYFYKTLA